MTLNCDFENYHRILPDPTSRLAGERQRAGSCSPIYTGRSPGQAEGLAGCGHSKIARVRAYYLYCMWLPLLTSLQI